MRGRGPPGNTPEDNAVRQAVAAPDVARADHASRAFPRGEEALDRLQILVEHAARLVDLWPASRIDELMPWSWGSANRIVAPEQVAA